jgi:hypothetical protein
MREEVLLQTDRYTVAVLSEDVLVRYAVELTPAGVFAGLITIEKFVIVHDVAFDVNDRTPKETIG